MRLRSGRTLILVLAGGYVAAWALSPLVLDATRSDLDLFFWPSAEAALRGQPLHIYSSTTLGAYPNANGPVGLLPLIPLAGLANRLGLGGDLHARATLAGILVAVVALLLALAAIRLIEQARGLLAWRVAAASAILLAPALWISGADYGHVEQPLQLLLVVLAASCALTRRTALAGVVFGLAILTRTTALLYLAPFVLLLVITQRRRPAAVMMCVAAATTAAGLAPFAVADGAGVMRALVTDRGDLPIGGGSVWAAAVGTPWAPLAQHADAYLIVAVAAVLSGVLVTRRPAALTGTDGGFGLLTVIAACVPMLARTAQPYYLLEPYVFAVIWWLARPAPALSWRALVPLLVTADVLVAKWGASAPLQGSGLVEGVASSGVLAVVVGCVMVDLLAGQSDGVRDPQEPSPPARRLLMHLP